MHVFEEEVCNPNDSTKRCMWIQPITRSGYLARFGIPCPYYLNNDRTRIPCLNGIPRPIMPHNHNNVDIMNV